MDSVLSNWSTVITAVIAVCALASPILTAVVNNHFSLKKQEQELKYQSQQNQIAENSKIYNQQIDIISDFIYSINAASITLNETDRKAVAKTGAKILVILKPADQKMVMHAIEFFNNNSVGWSSHEEIDKARALANTITQKSSTWLKQANKSKLR